MHHGMLDSGIYIYICFYKYIYFFYHLPNPAWHYCRWDIIVLILLGDHFEFIPHTLFTPQHHCWRSVQLRSQVYPPSRINPRDTALHVWHRGSIWHRNIRKMSFSGK